MHVMQTTINAWYTLIAPFYEQLMRIEEPPEARKQLFTHLNIQSGERVLEIGSGTGKNVDYYPSSTRVTFLDINHSMLRRAKRKQKRNSGSYTLVRADATRLPFADNSLDVVVMTYALSAIPENERALQEAERVTRPGGHIGILDFVRAFPFPMGGMSSLNLFNLLREREGNLVCGEYLPKKRQGIYILQVP
ncbi:methyltransferase domain-containing protein [Candidatus Woesearchaeota archaeon]|nr:methyltransferase domain-containing protein [Candidatus Woesearchaeota archaeon]